MTDNLLDLALPYPGGLLTLTAYRSWGVRLRMTGGRLSWGRHRGLALTWLGLGLILGWGPK